MAISRRSARLLLALIVLCAILACAWVAGSELHGNRQWDERWSMKNVHSILRTGNFEPVMPWYPSLSHLPATAVLAASQALHRITGSEVLAVLGPNGRLTSTAYLLARLLSVAYGAGALLLTFVLGRRLFSMEVGVLSALLLAASQGFLYAASLFKPDVLLILLSLAVFLWSLEAVRRGTLGSYLWAGIGVGLAAAAKQNGALTAVPLMVATALNARQRSRWLWLMAAGAASVAVFLLLNPFPSTDLEYLKMTSRFAQWASANQQELPPTLLYALRLPLSPEWHGRIIGSVSLLGFAGLAVQLIRTRRRGGDTVPLALFVSYPVLFALTCAAVSSLSKSNAFIPLLPFTAIAAAWWLHSAWQWVADRWPAAQGRPIRWAAVAAMLLVIGLPAASFVYASAVADTTLAEARRLIGASMVGPAHRSLFYEQSAGSYRQTPRFTRPRGIDTVARQVDTLTALPEQILNLADYEVFPESRLHSPERDFYLQRLRRALPSMWVVDPQFARRRGPRLMILGHPWTPASAPIPVGWASPPDEPRRRLRAALPTELARGDVVSFDLVLTNDQADSCRLSRGESELEVFPYRFRKEKISGRARRRVNYLTHRMILRKPRLALHIQCQEPSILEPRPIVTVWKWLPPTGAMDRRAP